MSSQFVRIATRLTVAIIWAVTLAQVSDFGLPFASAPLAEHVSALLKVGLFLYLSALVLLPAGKLALRVMEDSLETSARIGATKRHGW